MNGGGWVGPLPTAALLYTKTKETSLVNTGEYFEYQCWFPDATGASQRVLGTTL